MTAIEGSMIEQKSVLFSPSSEKTPFPRMEGWMTDYEKAFALAKEENKILVLAFLGTDFCPWSLKLSSDILSHADFVKEMKDEAILCWVGYTQDGENAAKEKLKEQYRVCEVPTVVVIDAGGEEITKMGYTPLLPQEFASEMKKSSKGYGELKEKLERSDLATMSGEILKDLYLKARDLGCNQYKNQILEAGVTADKGSFFLLEKYTRFVEGGKKKDKQAIALREEILERDPKNAFGSHLRLALLDFQSNVSGTKKTAPDAVVKPLTEYIAKFGKKDVENLWRVEMMIAQYLFSKNKAKEALKHAEASLYSAPEEHKPDVAQSVSYLKTHLANP